MVDDTVPCFGFPAAGREKVTAAFDGGRLTSDRADPTRVTHSFADMIRARIFAICCGYEDADRTRMPGMKQAPC